MVGKDKQRCKATHFGAAEGGTGVKGDACSAPLCKPPVAAGLSRGDIFLTMLGWRKGQGLDMPHIYLFAPLGCGGGSGNFLGQCPSAASRATLASPADPSGERHRHRRCRGPVVPGVSGELCEGHPGDSWPLPAKSKPNKGTPSQAAAEWEGNTLRHLFSPLPVPPSQSMCRRQKATLISNSLEDDFFLCDGLGLA